MSGKYGEKIKVRYIGETTYEFENGQVLEATFLKNDPKEKWYVIKSRDGEEEYAFPRDKFEIVEENG